MGAWPQVGRDERRRWKRAAAEVRGRGREGAPLARALKAAARVRPDALTRADADRIEGERRRLLRDRAELSGGRGTTATVADVTKRASSPPHQTWLLSTLVRETGARRCLEMGTCVGISGAYLAAASAAVGGGELVTLEGHEDRAAVARSTFERLGLDRARVVVGSFRKTLPGVLDDAPFDLAFVDGHHDGEATRRYVTAIRAASRPGALLVLDDIAWSDDMAEAWRALTAELSSSVSVDLGRIGLIQLSAEDAGRTLAAADLTSSA